MQGYRTLSEKGHRALLYEILDVLLLAAANAKDVMSDAHNKRKKFEYSNRKLKGRAEDLKLVHEARGVGGAHAPPTPLEEVLDIAIAFESEGAPLGAPSLSNAIAI